MSADSARGCGLQLHRQRDDGENGREAGGDHQRSALTLWHDTTARLALLIFPLAAFFLLNAHAVITFLFTNRYLASVQIFRVWCLMILPSVFAVDAVLRVYGQTRLLVVLNAVRLALIAGLIGWFMSTFGLIGAVLVTLVATSLVKAVAVVRIARLMNVGVADVLPWRRLGACGGSRRDRGRAGLVGDARSIAAAARGADLECRGVRHVVRGHLVPARAMAATRRPTDGDARAVGLPERGSVTRVPSCAASPASCRWDGRPVARRRSARDVPGDGASRTGRRRRLSRRGVGLGMRRLSIIDLEGGHQPISNEDGSIWVVFNGEIYNYRELRRQLDTRRPHVPHGERYGNDRPSLRGPRARGRSSACAACSRSRCGTRRAGSCFLPATGWASSRSTTRTSTTASCSRPSSSRSCSGPTSSRDLNWEAVGHLFTFLATPSSSSIVKGVRKLEPARIATATDGRAVRVERYWDVEFSAG